MSPHAPRPHYKFKKPPLGKQLNVIEDHWADPIHALLCRPGTGKSKMIIDHAGMQYMAGMIEALIVVAPNNVQLQWVNEAIPTHLSDQVPWMGGAFYVNMGVQRQRKLEAMLRSRDMGLRVLTISFEALQTKKGKEIAHALVSAYRCMVVIDESHRISNTKAQGYKAGRTLCRKGYTRRIATGTLLRQNPFSAYGQFELMDEGLLGFSSLTTFKSMFAEMLPPNHGLVKHVQEQFKAKTGRVITPQIQAKDPVTDQPLYKNLPYLRKQLAKWSSFMTLADVNGAEPVVFHSTRTVTLTPGQRETYHELVKYGMTEAPGGMLTADGTLALSIRLAQVVGGFAPSDDDPLALPLPDNPKMDELINIIEELGDEKVIIWAKYKAELLAIATRLAHLYGEDMVYEYHGDIKSMDREKAKAAFLGPARFLVANQKAAGTGLDGLQAVGRYMVFYSNDYSYLDREQAEARLARTGLEGAVNVIDIMAEETIDQDIVRCMLTAKDVTDKVLYPSITRRWI